MPAYSTATSIEETPVTQSTYRDSSRTVEYEKRMQDLRHAEKSVRVNGRYVGSHSYERLNSLQHALQKLTYTKSPMTTEGIIPNGIPVEEWKACREAVHKEVIELRTDYAPKRTLDITELTTTAEVAVPTTATVERVFAKKEVTEPRNLVLGAGLMVAGVVYSATVSFFANSMWIFAAFPVLFLGAFLVVPFKRTVDVPVENTASSAVKDRSTMKLPVHNAFGTTPAQKLQDSAAYLIEKISTNSAYTSTKFDSERIKLNLPEEMRQVVSACTNLDRMDSKLRSVEVSGWENMSQSVVDKIIEQRNLYEIAVNSLIDRVTAIHTYYWRLQKVEKLVKDLERELEIANRLINSDSEFSIAFTDIVGNEMATHHTVKCAVDVESFRERIESELKFIRAHLMGTSVSEIESV